jgi:predicted glycosyltransferase
MPSIRYPRILFYAVNGLGLGHVTRQLAIARQVRRLCPTAEILFFTTSEAEDVIFREGFAAFKAPSKSIRQTAAIRPATYSRLLQTVTLSLLAAFHPHILVVDTFPTGALQELLPCLRWDSRKVFVYREQRLDHASAPMNQSALQLYDLAIVPHQAGEAEIVAPDGLDTLWTGPILIRERDEALARPEARELLGLPQDAPILYLSFGGGGDPTIQTATCDVLEALENFEVDGKPLHIALAAPPLQRSRMKTPANVTPVSYYPMAEALTAFDAAVSAGGYNSVMELLHHGMPVAILPFARQVDDQEARAQWAEELGASITLADTEAETVRGAVEHLFNPEITTSMSGAGNTAVPGGGAVQAAEAIVKLLG